MRSFALNHLLPDRGRGAGTAEASRMTGSCETVEQNHTTKEGPMTTARSLSLIAIPAFLIGFGLGGLSLHVAAAQGLFGLKDSVTQIGGSLVQMQKNVDELQKNMNTIKQAKDQLASLGSPGDGASGMMDSLMNKSKK
jgi:hypothetical protein